MKKFNFLFFSLITLFFCSCQKQELDLAEQKPSDPVSTKIPIDSALITANNFFALIEDENAQTKAIQRTVGSVEVVGYQSSLTKSVSGNADLDSLFYVVNYSNDHGFAILSADTRLSTRVIGISDEGGFPMFDKDHPGVEIISDLLEVMAKNITVTKAIPNPNSGTVTDD